MAEGTFIWQEIGTPWRGVAIYHVTAAAVERNPVKGAFGELKWATDSEEVTDARVEMSVLGKRIRECIEEIPRRYPQIRICVKRIMPDHLHMVLYVTEQMQTTFNLVLRGWVQGCKKAAVECGLTEDVFADKPFIRVMSHRGHLQTMVDYVKQNPYRMAVRLTFSEHFAIQRGVEIAGQTYAAVGSLHLLYAPQLWQVHVHKERVWDAEKGYDKPLRDYKNRCVLEARKGAVLVGPFISPDEAAVRDVALKEKRPVIYIIDNGMPHKSIYKPTGELTEAIAQGRLLILAPWDEYLPERRTCTRAECNALNKMAEAIVKAAAQR